MKYIVTVCALLLATADASAQRTRADVLTDLEAAQALAAKYTAELRTLEGTNPDPDPDPDPDRPIQVPAGADLQAALDVAPAGAVIELPAGATYTWNFIIRKAVTLRTPCAQITGRVTSDHAAQLAQLVSGNAGTVVDILPGVDDVRFECIRIGPSTVLTDDLVKIGHGDATQNTLELQPRNITFDKVLIEGDPTRGGKRGISAHGAGITLRRFTIKNIFLVGQDSSGIGIWNGEGPYLIDDCEIVAASENVMVGGADPSIAGLIPSDITISNCDLTKDPAWRAANLATKNFVEFKTGRRVTVQRNRMGPQWASAQSYAIVITPSQYGTLPSQTVEDVTIIDNEMLDLPGGFNILGHGQNQSTRPTLHSSRITIRNNFVRINSTTQGGHGWFMQLGNCPRDLVVEQNTIVTNGNQYIQGNACSTTTPGFRFTGNLVHTIGAYGTFLRVEGSSYARGARWADYFQGGIMQGNGFVGDQSIFRNNLPNNLHLSTAAAAGLVVDGYGTGVLEPYGRRRP